MTLVLNYSNPITASIAFCAVFNPVVQVTDLVAGQIVSAGSGSVDSTTPFGPGVLFSNTDAGKATFGVRQPITSAAYTVLAVGNPAPDASTLQPTLFSQRVSGNPQIELMCNAESTTSAQQSGGVALFAVDSTPAAYGADTNGGGWVDGGYHVFSGRVTGAGAGNASIWVDGTNRTAHQGGGSFSGTPNAAGQELTISALGGANVNSYAANCSIPLVIVWNRALSDGEMASMGVNPFQFLFIPPPGGWITNTW